MANSWRKWCRLCARKYGNDVDIFQKIENHSDLGFVINKFFSIMIYEHDDIPTKICKKCSVFIDSIITFSDRCAKTEEMFSELLFQKYNNMTIDSDGLRKQFGIDELYQETIFDKTRIDKCTDTEDLPNECGKDSEGISHNLSNGLVTVLVSNENDGRTEIDEDNDVDILNIENYKKTEMIVGESVDVDENLLVSIQADYIKCSSHDYNVDEDSQSVLSADGMDSVEYVNDPDYVLEDEEDYAEEIKNTNGENEPTILIRSRRKLGKAKTTTRSQKFTDHFSEIYKCDECQKIFNRKSTLNRHIKSRHSNEKAKFSCPKCNKKFPTEKRLQQHEAVHLPPEMKLVHPCMYCDKKFTKSVNVQAHIKAIHIGERPFICEECGKSFSTKGALREHKYTHTEDTPFQCSRCPKKFKNSARLKIHEDTHNDTTYVCPHCGLQLNTKRTLQMHMVVHSDQKKYKCHFCCKEYKRSKALKNHLILHVGLRPYLCPFCDKTFANGSNCRSHKKKAHPQELAALEASGESHRVTNIPKLEQLKTQTAKVELPQITIDDKQNQDIPQQQQQANQLKLVQHENNQNSKVTSICETEYAHNNTTESVQQYQDTTTISKHQDHLQQETTDFPAHHIFGQINVSINT